MATKKQTQSERMKESWARRRAEAPNGKVTIKRRKKVKKRVARVAIDIETRSPLKLAWDTSQKVEKLLSVLPKDLRTIVVTHLNKR